jgi:hypothetical protein
MQKPVWAIALCGDSLMHLTRRALLRGSLTMGMVVVLGAGSGLPQDRKPTITVYKSPS